MLCVDDVTDAVCVDDVTDAVCVCVCVWMTSLMPCVDDVTV